MDEDEQEASYEIRYNDMKEDDPSLKYVAKDGIATATFANGDIYSGTYANGLREGQGDYKFFKGGRYNGQYVKGVKEGHGTFFYPDDSKYVGEWVNNQRHGLGTYYYSNGDKYCGNWSNDVKHGKGDYIHCQSEGRLEGIWTEGQLHEGKWVYCDGTYYKGSFKNNLPDGPGVFYFKHGNKQTGQYVQGNWIGEEISLL